MNKILILTGRYLPGYKDGGPVRSILNLTEWLGEEYDLRIVCLDRDHGDTVSYANIKINDWNEVGNAKVFYTDKYTKERIAELSKEVDLVYCCGPYNDYARAAMQLKKQGVIRVPLVVASMGSFSANAFAIKGIKKKAFVTVMKLLGYFDKVIWSVTSEVEEKELKAILGNNQKCIIASDLARKGNVKHKAVKADNELKIVFLSRISRKKNLVVVPAILEKVSKEVKLAIDIYGIAEDEEYLKECLENFEKLPNIIEWNYKGEIETDSVMEIFAQHDVFLFPTLGENFGHVIAESLGAGCVPVISDTTPWLDFEEHSCGYVRSLGDLNSFAVALDKLAMTNGEDFERIIQNCYDYIEAKKCKEAEESGYRKIFNVTL